MVGSLAENLSDWVKALDAFEREYGIPNPIPEDRAKWGRSRKHSGTALTIRKYNNFFRGEPWTRYPAKRRAEVLAFAIGYFGAGRPLEDVPLRHLLLLNDVPEDVISKAIFDSAEGLDFKKSLQTAIQTSHAIPKEPKALEYLATDVPLLSNNSSYVGQLPENVRESYRRGVNAAMRDREQGILQTTVQERLEKRLDRFAKRYQRRV